MKGERNTDVYITARGTDGERKAAIEHRELSLVLCDDRDGWDGGKKEGGSRGKRYMCVYIPDGSDGQESACSAGEV